MQRSFAVTYDYRCPFARNAHEHLVAALKAGAPWDVQFLPHSLSQNHVDEGEPSVFDEPHKDTGSLALQASIVVRDRFADRFHDLHLAMFAARHDEGQRLREDAVIRSVLTAQGLDASAVFDEMESGWPLKTLRDEHEGYVASHHVWGVPTFIVGDQAVYVRLMHRPLGDAEVATRTIERVVDLATWSELNEFKHTSIPA